MSYISNGRKSEDGIIWRAIARFQKDYYAELVVDWAELRSVARSFDKDDWHRTKWNPMPVANDHCGKISLSRSIYLSRELMSRTHLRLD